MMRGMRLLLGFKKVLPFRRVLYSRSVTSHTAARVTAQSRSFAHPRAFSCVCLHHRSSTNFSARSWSSSSYHTSVPPSFLNADTRHPPTQKKN